MTALEKDAVLMARDLYQVLDSFTVDVNNETDTIFLILHKVQKNQPLLMRTVHMVDFPSFQSYNGHKLEIRYKKLHFRDKPC
jgi:hypothetical protein